MLVVDDFSDLFSWLFHYFYGKQFFRALDCENKDFYALLQSLALNAKHTNEGYFPTECWKAVRVDELSLFTTKNIFQWNFLYELFSKLRAKRDPTTTKSYGARR